MGLLRRVLLALAVACSVGSSTVQAQRLEQMPPVEVSDQRLIGWWETVAETINKDTGTPTRLYAFIEFRSDSTYTSTLYAQERDSTDVVHTYEVLQSKGTWVTTAGPWGAQLICIRRAGAGEPKCQTYTVFEGNQQAEWGGFSFFKVEIPKVPEEPAGPSNDL